MAYSKARRLSDSISATGEVSAFVDGSITHADLHTDMDLTGKTVLVANASTGDSDTTAANTAFVQQEIAALVASAPGTLNTLNELAAALGDDASFSTTVTNSIALKAPLASPDFTGTLTASGLAYPTSDGTNGQALVTNGSGTLSFSTIQGYTDSDVETYLNTSEIYTDPTNNRVGIGTDSPDADLHVEGVTRTKYLRFQNLTDATSEVAGMYSSSGGGTNDLSIYASALSSTSSNIKFLTAPTNSATTTTLFLEGSSGNVGINDTSPSANSSGFKSLNISGGLITKNTAVATNNYVYEQRFNGSNNLTIGYNSNGSTHTAAFIEASNNLPLILNTGNANRMTINSSGSITSSTGGMTLQTKKAYNSTEVTTSGSDVTVISTTITILANSKIAVWFQSGQIQNSSGPSNPNFLIKHTIGSTTTNISDHNSNHWDYNTGKTSDARIFMTGLGISGSLSAGTYTVAVIGNVYNGTATWNYQNIGSTLIIQEISA